MKNTDWFTVFVSNTSTRITIHDEYCTAPERAKRARKGHVYEVEALDADDAVRIVNETEELAERGLPSPIICRCAITLSPSEV